MPLFEYKCKKCNHISEILSGAAGDEKAYCRKCGSAQLEKLFSKPAVHEGKNLSQASGCPDFHQCTGQCCAKRKQ